MNKGLIFAAVIIAAGIVGFSTYNYVVKNNTQNAPVQDALQ